MTTHHKQEVPERCSVGLVHTGYHGVDVNVTSVSAYLPSGEDNDAPFLGTTERSAFVAPTLTPIEEAAVRAQQIEQQRKDAIRRRVVWTVDDKVEDVSVTKGGAGGLTAGESYTDLLPALLEAYCSINNAPVPVGPEPVGVRSDDGFVVPLPHTELGEGSMAEAQYAGRPESMPVCIGQLVR